MYKNLIGHSQNPSTSHPFLLIDRLINFLFYYCYYFIDFFTLITDQLTSGKVNIAIEKTVDGVLTVPAAVELNSHGNV